MTNEQKYKTAKERTDAFRRLCGRYKTCRECLLSRICVTSCECFAHWLALEAEEEKIEPCPFCGDEVERAETLICKKGFSCSCGYTSKAEFGWDEAIAAHNRVARAVKAAEESEVKE